MINSDIMRFSHALTPTEIHALLDCDDPVILEIGCNDGTDTIRFLNEFPRARIFCFEPDPRPLARFVRGPCVELHRCQVMSAAVADVDGFSKFHLSGGYPPTGKHPADAQEDWDFSSSLSEPTGHLTWSPWCTFTRAILVPTIRLDTWLGGHPELDKIDFIWADVQGAEEKLIRGGRETLKRTAWFYTEFYDRPMYLGQPSLERMQQLLPDFNLEAIYGGDNALFRNRRLT